MRLNRSLLAAVVALALTAGAVFGHEMPNAAADGLATAMTAADKLLPVGHVQDLVGEDPTDPEVVVEEPVEDPTDPEVVVEEPLGLEHDGDSHCIVWVDGEPVVPADEEPNHGAYVCGAAHTDFRAEGFAEAFDVEAFVNRGAWMQWVHKFLDEGADTGVTSDEDGNGHGNGNGHGKPDGVGQGRGHGRGGGPPGR